MKRILLSAPYVGEIGWELMSWQARVRRCFVQGGYQKLVVLGSAGKAGFYDDMPLDYRSVDLAQLPGAAYEDRRICVDADRAMDADEIRCCVTPIVERLTAELTEAGHGVDVLWPNYDGTLYPCDDGQQRFVRYERRVEEPSAAPWVVLVERSRAFRGGINWPEAHWRELERLLNARGVRTTVYPCEAASAIAMLSACDLAVGQSTGGLHLAALCGCPTMVWSLQQYLMWPWEITNRQRYETWWNPLGSPVVFHEARQLPTPEVAADQVAAALRAVGRRTGSAVDRWLFRCKWSLRTCLKRQVIEPRKYARWPWPVQRLVRYGLA